MKIKIGNLEVLESGTVVGIEDEPIDFIFNEQTGFIFRIVFITDNMLLSHNRKTEKFGAGLKINFINYNYQEGIGNSIPFKLGKFNRRELFLNYKIYSIQNSGKVFHYTWLLGKEVQNG